MATPALLLPQGAEDVTWLAEPISGHALAWTRLASYRQSDRLPASNEREVIAKA